MTQSTDSAYVSYYLDKVLRDLMNEPYEPIMPYEPWDKVREASPRWRWQ